jgi:hypothetical protein
MKRFRSFVFITVCLWIALMTTPHIRAGTWKDDFNDGNFAGWQTNTNRWAQNLVTPNAGNWRVEEGTVVGGEADSGITHNLYTGDTSWKNYTAEVSVKLSKPMRLTAGSSGVWLGVRHQEDGISDYALGLHFHQGREVALVLLYINGNISERPDVAFPTKADTWYRLKVTVGGNQIQSFVDDKEIDAFWHDALPSGRVSLGANGVEAMFDNFVITGPDIPDGGPGLAVNSRLKLTTTWGEVKAQR